MIDTTTMGELSGALTIGTFSLFTSLTPKALRLYEEELPVPIR